MALSHMSDQPDRGSRRLSEQVKDEAEKRRIASEEAPAPWSTLTDVQRMAAEESVLGMTTAEIAVKHHVSRTTVWRWTKRQDFQAYKAWLETERRGVVREKASSVVLAALQCVATAIDDGDVKTAMGYLNIVMRMSQSGGIV